MERKIYFNEELEKMLNHYIKQEKYGKFKPILKDIFQRRAYEFQFKNKHMKKEIKNFVKRIDKLGFGKNIPDLEQTCYAVHLGDKKTGKIWFNCESKVFDTRNEYIGSEDWLVDVYQMLTHEIYHGISHDRFSIALRNSRINKGEALNEVVTENAASRTSYVRTRAENENFKQETNGYREITFIGNLLATSFGIEEREFLKGGLQNRKEFQKVCRKYISKEDYKNNVSFHFNILEANLDFLYNALYGEEENSNDEQIIVSSLKEICYEIYAIAGVRIEKSSREINSKYAEELAYEFQKIKTIIGNNIKRFVRYKRIDRETARNIIEDIDSSEEFLGYLNKVSDILVLTNRKSEIRDISVCQEMESLAKQGKLIENAEKFGIEIGKNLTTKYKLIQYSKKINHEFENPTQWNNQEVIEIMRQLWNEREIIDVAEYERELENKTILKKIKDFMAQLKNRNLKKLEVPKPAFKELKDNLEEKIKISPENLRPMKNENNVKKIRKEKQDQERL